MTTLPPATTAARPVTGLGNAVTALMATSGLLSLPLYVSSWTDFSRVSAHVERGMDDELFWQQEYGRFDFLFAALYVAIPALLASTAVLLVWSYRARSNAALISPHHRFRHSPAFSAGGLVIPFANIWFLRPIMEDIWNGSRPSGAVDDGARPVRTMWLWSVAGTVVSIVGDIAVPTSVITYDPSGRIVSGGSEAAGAALGAALLNTVLFVMAVVVAVKLVMVVRQVSRWQTEQLSV
jgi:uncharacterized protein DUF4328